MLDQVLLWGAFRLWRTHLPWTAFTRNLILASILIGMGGFNFYDGIVQHAILHLHLVNEHVCNIASNQGSILGICSNDVPYEIVWDLVGAVLLVAGIVWWRRLSRQVSAPAIREQ
ncbi:MAG: DUF2243 domain-containing protein [Chloroflexota bacterium]|nr:DUF2243 domain-containing protein [Chloroflexota bacterium]